jgi:hypothetical protein
MRWFLPLLFLVSPSLTLAQQDTITVLPGADTVRLEFAAATVHVELYYGAVPGAVTYQETLIREGVRVDSILPSADSSGFDLPMPSPGDSSDIQLALRAVGTDSLSPEVLSPIVLLVRPLAFATPAAPDSLRLVEVARTDSTIDLELWYQAVVPEEGLEHGSHYVWNLLRDDVLFAAGADTISGCYTDPRDEPLCQARYDTVTVPLRAAPDSLTTALQARLILKDGTLGAWGTSQSYRWAAEPPPPVAVLQQTSYRGSHVKGESSPWNPNLLENQDWANCIDDPATPPGNAESGYECAWLLRFAISEVGGAAIDASFGLEYERNRSGTWVPVNGSSDIARAIDSDSAGDNDRTTDQLVGGTGPFVAGGRDNFDGLIPGADVGTIPLCANCHTELEFILVLLGAVEHGDSIRFRVVDGDGDPLGQYLVHPQVTVDAPPDVQPPPPAPTLDSLRLWVETADSVVLGSRPDSVRVVPQALTLLRGAISVTGIDTTLLDTARLGVVAYIGPETVACCCQLPSDPPDTHPCDGVTLTRPDLWVAGDYVLTASSPNSAIVSVDSLGLVRAVVATLDPGTSVTTGVVWRVEWDTGEQQGMRLRFPAPSEAMTVAALRALRAPWRLP